MVDVDDAALESRMDSRAMPKMRVGIMGMELELALVLLIVLLPPVPVVGSSLVRILEDDKSMAGEARHETLDDEDDDDDDDMTSMACCKKDAKASQ